ncbi:MAG: F0F1 ATP synthase subunit B [Verrucomicrobia bacterium]|nr:F0F1 ATP synthase subunit B [Verrucomicrobiota bacterium]MBV9658160.1 F0F1 ATP synthase subunit B [Verrucomicrobiota bacterium]
MDKIAQTFGVTWPTFIAQLLTVGIVYFVLKKYAFSAVIKMLEERRRRIEEGQANAEKIKRDLAAAEARHREILDQANAQAQKLIDEARQSSNALADRRQQDAIGEAERIIARAHEATQLEYERVLNDLKREVARLVIDTTAKVSGKVLTDEDQRILSEETARQIAA